MQSKHQSVSSLQVQRKIFVWGSLIPILSFFIVFSFLPIFASFYISFHEWPLLGKEKLFIGLKNYGDIIQDPRFWNSLKNTAYYTIFLMVFVIIFGLVIALLVNRTPRWVQTILRPIYFAPQVTSAIAVALMFTWLFQPQWGLLNHILGWFGLGPYLWLQSSTQVMPAIIITGVWRAVGYSMVIFTAGLMGIPIDVRESAAIDGANGIQTFWHIVIPLLQPTLLFMTVTSLIGGFQVFNEVWMMSGGGPGTASRVLVLDIYDQGFRYFEMGRASAIAFYLFIIVAVISYFQLRFMRESYEF